MGTKETYKKMMMIKKKPRIPTTVSTIMKEMDSHLLRSQKKRNLARINLLKWKNLTRIQFKRRNKSKKKRVKRMRNQKINSTTLPKTTVYNRGEPNLEVFLSTLKEKESMKMRKKKMLETVYY